MENATVESRRKQKCGNSYDCERTFKIAEFEILFFSCERTGKFALNRKW